MSGLEPRLHFGLSPYDPVDRQKVLLPSLVHRTRKGAKTSRYNKVYGERAEIAEKKIVFQQTEICVKNLALANVN